MRDASRHVRWLTGGSLLLLCLAGCPAEPRSVAQPTAAEPKPSADTIQAKAAEAVETPASKRVASERNSQSRNEPALVAAPPGESSEAGMTYDHVLAMSGPDAVFSETEDDVIVATVTEAASGTPTNGTPPVVGVQVHEVLAGEPGQDRTRARFLPFPHDIDWANDEADALRAAWANRPLPGPAVGSKWVLVGSLSDEVFDVRAIGCFRYSEAQRASAVAAIEQR